MQILPAVGALALTAFLHAVGAESDPGIEAADDQGASTGTTDSWKGLALDPDDPMSQLALALHEVREGRARRGHAMLAEMDLSVVEDDVRERIAIECERMAKWIELRTAFVDHMIEKGTKVTFELDGEKLTTKILGRTYDTLELDKNRQKIEKLSLARIPTVQIAKCMAKGTDEQKCSWVRVYGYALASDPRWRKLLRDACGDAELFRADAENVYPALLVSATVAAELESLSNVAAPASGTEADVVLARIGVLRTEHGEHPLVQARAASFGGLARASLAARFDSLPLDEVLHGRVEELPGDRVKLSYDFKAEEQREDFTEDKDYLTHLRAPAGKVSPDTKTIVSAGGGALLVQGSTSLRHPLELAAPIEVRFELEYLACDDMEGMACRSMIALNDDGNGSFAGCIDFGNLLVRDRATRFENSAFDLKGSSYLYDTPYELSMHQDAEGVLTSTVSKEEKQKIDGGERRSGSILLWFHTQSRIRNRTLAVEGALTAQSTTRVRESWIAAQLKELGME